MHLRSVLFSFLLSVFSLQVNSQTKVEGFVMDQISNERLSQIQVLNLNSGADVISDAKGQFEIAAKLNDLLVFRSIGYRSDTVLVINFKQLKHYMLASVHNLKTVQVRQTSDYKKQYATVLNRANPILLKPGRGLLFYPTSYFSREGRQARYFKRMIKAEQGELEIDRKFNRNTVTAILPLKQPELDGFMIQFRPTLAFVRRADAEDFKFYLIDAYNKFNDFPPEKRRVTVLKSGINN